MLEVKTISGKSFAGSVVVSLVIIMLVAFFILPIQYPRLNNPAYVYEEFRTSAIIADYNLTLVQVPDTQATITIRGNSRIWVEFNTPYVLGISGAFPGPGRVRYEFVLMVEGVGNRTTYLTYYTENAPGASFELSSTFYLNYVTEPLLAGTYTISVYWRSIYDRTGFNYLLLNTMMYNWTRSLLLQEIFS